MQVPVPTKVLHAMPVQGGLVTDVLEKATPYESWVGLSEALPYVPPEPYIATELMQPRSMNVPFSGVLNYRDVRMTHMAVCHTKLQMCRKSLYDHEDQILSMG